MYKVVVKDGHGEQVIYIPAQSGDVAEKEFDSRRSPHQKIVAVDFDVWMEISCGQASSEAEGVAFTLGGAGNRSLTFHPGDLGHEHLRRQFPTLTDAVERHIAGDDQ
jgi:hypothetical protein